MCNRFETSEELTDSQTKTDAPSTPLKKELPIQRSPLRAKNNVPQKWMFALLLYNTCVAPMSSYCANNILQYGMDQVKYNVLSHILKFLMREVIKTFKSS